MSIRNQLMAVLRHACGEADVVVIHSSMVHFSFLRTIEKWDFLYALRTLVKEGKTVVLPSFTFEFCKTGKYTKELPSEVGVLADWALLLEEFQRTEHPIFSYVVSGPKAQEVLTAENTTTFGADSVLAIFEKLEAQFIMLGCNWYFCTQFHRYEEKHLVPYRYFKTFSGENESGEKLNAEMFVRYLEIDSENDFSVVEKFLRENDCIKSFDFYGAKIESANVCDIAKFSDEVLTDDKYAFIENKNIVRFTVNNIRNKKSKNIALLGNSNLSHTNNDFMTSLKENISNISYNVFSVDYGQVEQNIINPDSELYKIDAQFSVFLNRLEDLTGVVSLESSNVEKTQAALDQYISMIRLYRERNAGGIFVFLFAQLTSSSFGSAGTGFGYGPIVQKANETLRDQLSDLNDIHFIDIATYAAEFSSGSIVDERMWFLGRFPFSDAFSKFLAQKMTGLIIAANGLSTRLIVLDLDNTLWGGILGDDGVDGLSLGGDYPGNAFVAFQTLLKKYSQRGVALAVCSKNDEENALKAINTLPEMRIRTQDVVAHRINWQPKWQNILQMAEDLSLGLANIMFIDDNPVERELVKRHLPEVKVVDLPSDPCHYAQTVRNSIWLECLSITKEDAKRVASYKKRSETLEEKKKYSNLEEFYASLEPQLTFAIYSEENKNRALQLIQKTNQFNTTTRRYSSIEIENMLAQGASVYVIGLEDRFFDFENIGVLILKWVGGEVGELLVDSFILSCRVLGRGLEKAILDHVKDMACVRRMKQVVGELIKTERNTPARLTFANAGFHEVGSNWNFVVEQDKSYTPEWVRIRKLEEK